MSSALCERGAFIVFEGVDRSGKSTQCRRLAEAIGARLMRFPERTTAIGGMINSYLQNSAELQDNCVHLLFSANRWELSGSIKETLQSGQHVVCDRYAYSGVAFSAAKEGLSMEWCRNPDRGLPAPDAVVFLDLSIEDAMQRGEWGGERYEKEDMQRKVRDNFHLMMAHDRRLRDAGDAKVPEWHVVDARGSMDEVADKIQKEVQEILRKRAGGAQDVLPLWMDSEVLGGDKDD